MDFILPFVCVCSDNSDMDRWACTQPLFPSVLVLEPLLMKSGEVVAVKTSEIVHRRGKSIHPKHTRITLNIDVVPRWEMKGVFTPSKQCNHDQR